MVINCASVVVLVRMFSVVPSLITKVMPQVVPRLVRIAFVSTGLVPPFRIVITYFGAVVTLPFSSFSPGV